VVSFPMRRPEGGKSRVSAAGLATELLPRVRNLVRYLIRGDGDVDDVAQESLVSVLRGLETYRGEGTLEAWADRITARTTFAWLRRRQADQEREREAAELRAFIGDAEPAPDEYVARRRMVRLLDALPLEQRHALVLHHVLEMTVPEVAAELDVPIETVRSRLRLAKQRLGQLGSPLARQEAG
jgi:RNA polymerase sigma-70 factor, ECF subfamily